MVMPKDIARSYPKRGITADVGFRSEPKFCGDGSVYFDGSSDYAETAASTDLAVGDTFTLTAWVWLNPNPGGASKYALRVGDTGAAAPNIASIGVFGGANPTFYCYNGSGSMSSSVTCDSARWYHVASVIKSGAGNSQLFVDGIDVTNSHSTVFNVTSASSKIRIGDWNSGANDWEGYIANACLFTESLTEDQVRQAMRASDYASHAAIATLEAFYPLSENFNDSTGNHNATLTGSVSFGVNRPQLPRGLDLTQNAAQARVYSGRAVDFDGSADRITAAHYNPSGDYLTTTAWVNADTLRAQGLIHNGNTGRNSFLFYMVASGKVLFYWNDTTGDGAITHQTNLVAGRWYHLAAVMDMSDPADHQVTYYIDGIAATGSRTASGWSADDVYQFGNQYATFGWFDGKIADCRIYDVALTQAQVRELYHNPEQVLPTGVSASNLRRYYPLSDYNDTGGTGGRYFQDMGADGEPAEDLGSSSMAFAQPVPCPQLGLQQSASRLNMNATTNNTYVRSDLMSGTPFTNQGTLSAWFIMQALPGTAKLDYNSIAILGAYQTDKDLLEIVYDNYSVHGSPNIWITDGSGDLDYATRYNHTFELGKLQHVVITTLATSPYWQLWINGEKKTVSPKNFSSSRSAWDFGDNRLNIGRWGDGPYGGTCRFTSIQTSAWNTVLSDPEIGQVYNSGVPGDVSGIASSDLQVWWKSDDLTSFKDYSGNGVSGAVTVGTVAPGLVSFPENASGSTIVGDFSLKRKGVSVLNFAESDNAAEAVIPAQSSLFPNATGYTISVWVKGRRSGLAGYVIQSATTTTLDRVAIATQTSNEWVFEFPRISGSSSSVLCPLTYDGEWHCMTATIDSATNTIKTYTDGILQVTSATAVVNTAATPSNIRINPDASTYWSGVPVALLKIGQQVWTDDEVQRNYYSDLRLIKGLANE